LLLTPYQDGALRHGGAHGRHHNLERPGVHRHLLVQLKPAPRGPVRRSEPLRSGTMKPIDPANGPSPPSTSTTTASQNGITRFRAAQMQTSDIPIQSSPWLIPRMKVSGSGFPSAKAQ